MALNMKLYLFNANFINNYEFYSMPIILKLHTASYTSAKKNTTVPQSIFKNLDPVGSKDSGGREMGTTLL